MFARTHSKQRVETDAGGRADSAAPHRFMRLYAVEAVLVVPTRRPYVQAADFVRAVTVVSMIAVHSTWYMAAGGQWLVSGAILALLHYTRESFMALTGFVLTYSLHGRIVRWPHVLGKRYRLVLFPYLVWTAVYMLAFTPYRNIGGFALSYGRNLLNGDGWFHLYYLLITMQFYVVLPLFLGLMRIAQKRPLLVALGAIVFELALTSYDQYGLGRHPEGVNAYTGVEVWTYAAYFVVGGIAALYWPSVRQWLRRQLPGIVLMAAATAFFVLAAFFLQARIDGQLERADAVIQPVMVPWSLSVLLLLAALGVRYEEACTHSPRGRQVIKWIAELSFGLYLIHPLLLQLWTQVLAQLGWYRPSYGLDAVTVVLLVLSSAVATQVLIWTPVRAWIIGREASGPGATCAIVSMVGYSWGNRTNWTWGRPRRKSP